MNTMTYHLIVEIVKLTNKLGRHTQTSFVTVGIENLSNIFLGLNLNKHITNQ